MRRNHSKFGVPKDVLFHWEDYYSLDSVKFHVIKLNTNNPLTFPMVAGQQMNHLHRRSLSEALKKHSLLIPELCWDACICNAGSEELFLPT